MPRVLPGSHLLPQSIQVSHGSCVTFASLVWTSQVPWDISSGIRQLLSGSLVKSLQLFLGHRNWRTKWGRTNEKDHDFWDSLIEKVRSAAETAAGVSSRKLHLWKSLCFPLSLWIWEDGPFQSLSCPSSNAFAMVKFPPSTAQWPEEARPSSHRSSHPWLAQGKDEAVTGKGTGDRTSPSTVVGMFLSEAD